MIESSVDETHTKCITIADLGSPASYQVNFVLGGVCHPGVPTTYKLDILVDLVRLDFVEDDRMDVFAAGEDLGEGPLHLLVQLLAFRGAVDQTREFTGSSGRGVCLGLPRFFCMRGGRK